MTLLRLHRPSVWRAPPVVRLCRPQLQSEQALPHPSVFQRPVEGRPRLLQLGSPTSAQLFPWFTLW